MKFQVGKNEAIPTISAGKTKYYPRLNIHLSLSPKAANSKVLDPQRGTEYRVTWIYFPEIMPFTSVGS